MNKIDSTNSTQIFNAANITIISYNQSQLAVVSTQVQNVPLPEIAFRNKGTKNSLFKRNTDKKRFQRVSLSIHKQINSVFLSSFVWNKDFTNK